MFFIALLIASAVAIAGSAAYFSVYGLANVFSGVFWSVVIMGTSLEAGKLVAASYLYRYWDVTNKLLRSYLMAGVVALMLLTSGGIFGYLSSGYQADVLPLKQLNSQIALLEDERTRTIQRKQEIDKQITQMPENFVTARIRLMREFEQEQKAATARIKQLDNELLELKTKQIKTEAHIGPITYIAKAFDVQTDDATKWLVFLIIFAFDPMAVALTLAVNVALRRREEERRSQQAEQPARYIPARAETSQPRHPIAQHGQVPPKAPPAPAPRTEPVVVEEPSPVVVTKTVEKEPVLTVEKPFEDIEQQLKQQIKTYPQFWKNYVEGTSAEEKIQQLLDHYKHLETRQKSGATLTKEEQWEMKTIKEILSRKGLDVYLK